MRTIAALVLAICCAVGSWAAGEAEASMPRAEYLAERGQIIPYHEVRLDDLIGSYDYSYPDPEGEFGVYLYTGHRQVSAKGQSEILQVGVQGRRYSFADLPPMNLVAVVDKSGSMREPDKMDWVKESLEVLAASLRDRDYLSLVSFDDQPEVVTPSTRMSEPGARRRFQNAIQGLAAGGESDITAGVAAGFEQAMTHFTPTGTNRVLLLTDGWGGAAGITKLVRQYRSKGIEISVIGYGENFDTRFAEAIYDVGGGSTRFVSDRERMEEIFGSGLARTAVPLARNVQITVILEEGQVYQAWGLDPLVQYNLVRFTVPVLHNGDYETAVASLQFWPDRSLGERVVATVQTRYTDLQGVERELEPVQVWMEFVPADNPLTGFSDARALKAGTMLRYAQALLQISGTYHQTSDIYQAFFRSFEMKKELSNAATRLGDDSFADEIALLENYMRIIGKNIGFTEGIVEQIITVDELVPPEPERPLEQHLDFLFRELVLHLEKAPPGNLAVSGFSVPGQIGGTFVDLLNEAGAMHLRNLVGPAHPLVERRRLDEILREQELALSDLVEPGQALRVGEILAASYIVTGTVIPMSESVVIFGRILNVETAVIESVAQVIVRRTEEVDRLL
jgi:hypothetical protein